MKKELRFDPQNSFFSKTSYHIIIGLPTAYIIPQKTKKKEKDGEFAKTKLTWSCPRENESIRNNQSFIVVIPNSSKQGTVPENTCLYRKIKKQAKLFLLLPFGATLTSKRKQKKCGQQQNKCGQQQKKNIFSSHRLAKKDYQKGY